ncbi:MAG TPA: SRPBCC domain-containing protein [Stellaceae bacterium]|nr:SRPBCC domain-containing protein [Stellaceae bacterium]
MAQQDDQGAAGASDLALTLTRVLEAPREAVFAAWTDPAQLTRWLGPGKITAEVQKLDLREGGAYRIVMHDVPAGGANVVTGIYRAIEPPSRLVFTWAWEEHAATHRAGHESIVTITLRALGNRTELTLRHERFDTKKSRDSHDHGWNGCFDKLTQYLKPGRA